ncbi:hypothetical protein ACI65C_004795 [Semiaphis heraclei]
MVVVAGAVVAAARALVGGFSPSSCVVEKVVLFLSETRRRRWPGAGGGAFRCWWGRSVSSYCGNTSYSGRFQRCSAGAVPPDATKAPTATTAMCGDVWTPYTVVIREIGGSRGTGLKYKDDDGYTYWKNQQCRMHFTVRCASWRAGCRAKGKVLNNDSSEVFLTTGHETHPENQLALERFKHICNQRAQDEQTSLRVIYNEGFPIGFALMSRKTERAYTALFNKILSIVPEWQPQIVIVDFGRAAITAIRTIFPYNTIRGLVEICSNHQGAYDTVHKLMALPLLPQNCIAEGFETVREYYIKNVQSLISNNNDYKFSLLFEYYRSTWLAGINADILSVSDTVWRTNNPGADWVNISGREFVSPGQKLTGD